MAQLAVGGLTLVGAGLTWVPLIGSTSGGRRGDGLVTLVTWPSDGVSWRSWAVAAIDDGGDGDVARWRGDVARWRGVVHDGGG